MPPPFRKNLPHRALYWRIAEGAQRTDAYGEVQVHQPVELRVRWETIRAESVNFEAQGATVAYQATVTVPQEVTIDSLMWLGGFDDWYGTGTGGDEDGLGGNLHQVKGYEEVPDTKGRDAERTAKLIRYRDALPTVLDD